MKPPEDVNAYYESCIQEKNPAFKPMIDALRARMKEWEPEATEAVNGWGVCTFEFRDATIAYFMVNKGHVTFGFPRGSSLPDPHKLLTGTGKGMRHVKLKKIEDLDHEGVRGLLIAAALLQKDDPVKGMGGEK
jgi:hypothetical protein